MTSSMTRLRLDVYNQSKVELWRMAAADLASGPTCGDLFVQASLHAILAWLRTEANEPMVLLELFGRPRGPLGAQLRLIGSLLPEPSQPAHARAPRLWWTVAKAAYYARWLELAAASTTRQADTSA